MSTDPPQRKRSSKAMHEHKPVPATDLGDESSALVPILPEPLTAASERRPSGRPKGRPKFGLQSFGTWRRWLDAIIALLERVLIIGWLIVSAAALGLVVVLFIVSDPAGRRALLDFLENHWHVVVIWILVPLGLRAGLLFLERVEKAFGMSAPLKISKPRKERNPVPKREP
jgi:hypothetical protein